jgi:hypothetical protein
VDKSSADKTKFDGLVDELETLGADAELKLKELESEYGNCLGSLKNSTEFQASLADTSTKSCTICKRKVNDYNET